MIRPALRWLLWVQLPVLLTLALSHNVRSSDEPGLFARLEAQSAQRYGRGAAVLVRDWGRLVGEGQRLSDAERLTLANGFFNRRLPFEEDIIVWRVIDHWATPLEFTGVGMGDCEDYVIAKYKTLQLMGVPRERLRFIYVRASIGAAPPVAHMVLGYYAEPGAEPLILDNLVPTVRPASQRTDLAPVYSFNAEGLWVGNASRSAADPTVRLSKWRDLLQRLREEGLN